MAHYATLTIVKQRLRVEDSSLDDELSDYIDEIDTYVNRKLRRKLGHKNEYGDEIVLPLTTETIPALTFDLNTISNDLVIGKFRHETTADDALWKKADEELEEFLTETYGWATSSAFKMNPQLTFTPTSGSANATVTVSGSEFGIRNKLKVYFNGQEMATSPDPLVADDKGSFSDTTFTIPAGTTAGTFELKVVGVTPTDWKKHDLKTGYARNRFRVV